LFDSKPRLLAQATVENFLSMNSKVGVRGLEGLAGAVNPLIGLSHHDDVLAFSEGVSVVGNGSHDDLRVVGGGLVARGTIVVPLGDVGKGCDLSFKSSALRTESDTGSVNPDVLSYSNLVDFLPAVRVIHVLVVQ